jgi:hypothetical protein
MGRVAASWRKDRRRRIQRANRRLPRGMNRPETVQEKMGRAISECREAMVGMRAHMQRLQDRVTGVDEKVGQMEECGVGREVGREERVVAITRDVSGARNVQEERGCTTTRIRMIEQDLAETKGILAGVQAAMDAAEVEFAVTDCGDQSESDVGVASVGSEQGCEEGEASVVDREEGETVRAAMVMDADEFGAAEDGSFVPICGGKVPTPKAAATIDWQTLSAKTLVKEFFAMVAMAAENGGFVPVCGDL